MAKSTTIQQYKTPKCSMEWAFISGEGRENLKGIMQYVITAVLTVEQKDELETVLDAFWKENKPKGVKEMKSNGLYPQMRKTDKTDEDGDPIKEPTGKWCLNFKTSTTWPDGKPNKVKVYNAKGGEVQLGDKKIGNGTEGRILGAYDIYAVKSKAGSITNAGITFYLNGVQVSKLVEFSADQAPDAMDDEEDGWTGLDDEFVGDVEEQSPSVGPRL